MTGQHFSKDFLLNQAAMDVFNAINDITPWWSEDFTGRSKQLGDEFEVRFGDVHYSRHKLIELVPGQKVVWLVTGSKLTFIKDMSEWTGTKVNFEISSENEKTLLRFTHVGLNPEVECFKDCSKGWTHYLNSLISLITTGTGQPNKKKVPV